MDKKYTFQDLLDIVAKIRGQGGCPWDMEQTHESIKHNIIEEGYELIEALEGGNGEKMADESGDLLLQVVFHAQIGKEDKEYDIDDVISAVCSKLIHRHPHVFGDIQVKDSDEVLANWNKIKMDDRGQKTVASDMDGVSKGLPSLMRAQKVQGKAAKSGYIFNEPHIAHEAMGNMISLLEGNEDKDVAEKYIGKMLFELVSVARAKGVDAEVALSKHINSFIAEFTKHEE